MKSVIAIPARLQSSRLPRKLLLEETGRPLICHTVEAAVKACAASNGAITGIVVATDDQAIADSVQAYSSRNEWDVRAILTRTDHTSGSDRIAEAVSGWPHDVDAVINLQGDEPEADPSTILSVHKLLEQYQSGSMPADIATLIYPLDNQSDFENPNLVKAVFASDGTALYFSRSPIPHHRVDTRRTTDIIGYGHVGLYAYRRDSLERFVSLPKGSLEEHEKLEQLRALEHGMRIVVGQLTAPPAKGIDTAEDYQAFVNRFRDLPH